MRFKSILFFLLFSLVASVWASEEIDNSFQASLSYIRSLEEGDEPLMYEVLKGGGSEATLYKVSVAHRDYVVRVTAHRPMEDRIREIQAQEIASVAGYGPHLYGYDIDAGWIVMEFIPRESKGSMTETEKALKLASFLKKIHNGPALFEKLSVLAITKEFLASLDPRYHSLIDYRSIQSIIQDLAAFEFAEKTSTHCDVHPGNLFYSKGEFKIIDFEDSGQDDPLIDVAMAAITHLQSQTAEALLFETYLGHLPSQEEWGHYYAMKKLVFIRAGLNHLNRNAYDSSYEDLPQRSFEELWPSIFKDDGVELDGARVQVQFAISLINEAIATDVADKRGK